MSNQKLCCEIFTDLLNDAGKKGISIIPTDIYKPRDYYFVLQSRSTEPENKIDKLVIAQHAIHYCPWCGSKLSEVINNNRSWIAELADKNKHLIIQIL